MDVSIERVLDLVIMMDYFMPTEAYLSYEISLCNEWW